MLAFERLGRAVPSRPVLDVGGTWMRYLCEGQGRLGDRARVVADAHGCPACPHPGLGPAIEGSPDVRVNGRPALRVGDPGIQSACCGGNRWEALTGSGTV